MRKIYLDNAATTPVDKKVFLEMKPYFFSKYGNPSEPHSLGREAKIAVEKSREILAKNIGAKPNEIIFTSSATESINLSHKGFIEAVTDNSSRKMKPHIITSSIEHRAVIETCEHLEKLDMADVTYLPVTNQGLIEVEDIKKAIRKQTVLISIMYVNNEIGTIQPIKHIGDLIKNSKRKIYFHTDVTQAIQYLDCNVDNLGVDLLSFTGHKINAPKGIGALFVRNGTPVSRQQDGGEQEMKLRAATENVPYIVGFGKAIELVSKSRNTKTKRIKFLSNLLIKKVLEIPEVTLTGHSVKRSPYISSFIVKGVEGEAMTLYLSEKGIFVSSGSACTSNNLQSSHVLTAMGIPAEDSHGSIRFSLGKETTRKDIDYATSCLVEIINKLRLMSPEISKL